MQVCRQEIFETALTRWLLRYGRGRRRIPRSLEALLTVRYGDVVESIRSRRCPFCGREFSRMAALANHLSRASSRLSLKDRGVRKAVSVYTNPCYVMFQMFIAEVIREWSRFRREVMNSSGREKGQNYYVRAGGRTVWFRRMEDAVRFLATRSPRCLGRS